MTSRLERIQHLVRALSGLLCALVLVFSCGEASSPPQEGSETHFLQTCSASCPSGMKCVCGACTSACNDNLVCDALSGAARCTSMSPRVAQLRCGEASPARTCDVACVDALDCSLLDRDFACIDGYCRTPSFSPPVVEPRSCSASNLQPEDVLILGDVLIELSTFAAELEARANEADKLAAGAHYRNRASSGNSFFGGTVFTYASVYATAKAERPARVVIMDGGATDVLNNNCAGMLNNDCPAAVAAVEGAERLFETFAADGVEHLVYFYYHDAVENSNLRDGIDLLRPLLRNVCGKSPVPCHFVDLKAPFAGHPEYSTGVDGIVFSDVGAGVAADAVWAMMEERCVAQ